MKISTAPQTEPAPKAPLSATTRTKRSLAAEPVFKLKEILVPVDFTECTDKALAYAVPFAEQFGARITLLHVVEPAYLPATEVGMMMNLEDPHDAAHELQKLASQIKGPVPIRTEVRKGNAETEIVDVAREMACDLIILSTHGRTGVERLLMGSTVEKVTRRAGCPIFIVRPHERDFVDEPTTTASTVATGSPMDRQVEAEMIAGD